MDNQIVHQRHAGATISQHDTSTQAKQLTPWINPDERMWERYANVTCVECPDCCFRFDAAHQNSDSRSYSCPNCRGNALSTTSVSDTGSLTSE